ncbi:MAG: hypothetical protein CM1200mP12_18950 [Gammaproteobacteria bacterium]|nr:MAG: hypothetical protein CM1200mP12_18950 [Gammaproteobacteria bacterium]
MGLVEGITENGELIFNENGKIHHLDTEMFLLRKSSFN